MRKPGQPQLALVPSRGVGLLLQQRSQGHAAQPRCCGSEKLAPGDAVTIQVERVHVSDLLAGQGFIEIEDRQAHGSKGGVIGWR